MLYNQKERGSCVNFAIFFSNLLLHLTLLRTPPPPPRPEQTRPGGTLQTQDEANKVII